MEFMPLKKKLSLAVGHETQGEGEAFYAEVLNPSMKLSSIDVESGRFHRPPSASEEQSKQESVESLPKRSEDWWALLGSARHSQVAPEQIPRTKLLCLFIQAKGDWFP